MDTKSKNIKDIGITVIGCGNMGAALIKGLVKAGYKNITACDSDNAKLAIISKEYAVKTTKQIAFDEIVILAVKPNNILEAIEKLSTNTNIKKSLVISVAAGTMISKIKKSLPVETKVARVMPNIPAVVGEACSAIYAESKEDAELVKEIFSTIGKSFVLQDEKLIDTSTALCGSGPAFFALFIQALSEAAAKLGLEQDTANQMALQTALGTCKFLVEQNVSAKQLQEMVSSPGGTTLAGLKNFEDHDFLKVVEQALLAATSRAREIASQH